MDISKCFVNINIAHGAGSAGKPGRIGRRILEIGIVKYVTDYLIPEFADKAAGISFRNPFGQWYNAMHFDQFTVAKKSGVIAAWDEWSRAFELLCAAFPEVIAYLGEFTNLENMTNARAYTDGITYSPVKTASHWMRVSWPGVVGDDSVEWEEFLVWAKQQVEPLLQTGANLATGIQGGFPVTSNRGKFLQWVAELKGRVYIEPHPTLVNGWMNQPGFRVYNRERFVLWQESEDWNGGFQGPRVRPEDLVDQKHIDLIDGGTRDRTERDTTPAIVTQRQGEGWICHVRDHDWAALEAA